MTIFIRFTGFLPFKRLLDFVLKISSRSPLKDYGNGKVLHNMVSKTCEC